MRTRRTVKADPTFLVVFWSMLIIIWAVGSYFIGTMGASTLKLIFETKEYVNPAYLREPKSARGIWEIPETGMIPKMCDVHKTMFWAFDSLLSDSTFEKYCQLFSSDSISKGYYQFFQAASNTV